MATAAIFLGEDWWRQRRLTAAAALGGGSAWQQQQLLKVVLGGSGGGGGGGGRVFSFLSSLSLLLSMLLLLLLILLLDTAGSVPLSLGTCGVAVVAILPRRWRRDADDSCASVRQTMMALSAVPFLSLSSVGGRNGNPGRIMLPTIFGMAAASYFSSSFFCA